MGLELSVRVIGLGLELLKNRPTSGDAPTLRAWHLLALCVCVVHHSPRKEKRGRDRNYGGGEQD